MPELNKVTECLDKQFWRIIYQETYFSKAPVFGHVTRRTKNLKCLVTKICKVKNGVSSEIMKLNYSFHDNEICMLIFCAILSACHFQIDALLFFL